MAASADTSRSGTPPGGMNRMKFAHMAWDTSHGPRDPAAGPRVVRCWIWCSDSLSNSMVKATRAWASSAGSGRSAAAPVPGWVARCGRGTALRSPAAPPRRAGPRQRRVQGRADQQGPRPVPSLSIGRCGRDRAAVRQQHLAGAGELRGPAVPSQPADRIVRGGRPAQRHGGRRLIGRRAVAEGQAEQAARGGQVGHPVQQLVHVVRAEVDEQALGQPGGWLVRPQARRPQRGRPVVPQVAGDGDPFTAGHGVLRGEHLLLAAQHVLGVEFIAAHAGWPGQPERPGVKAGAEQHHLPGAVRAGGHDQLVEEYGAGHHPQPQRGGLPPGGLPRRGPGGRHERASQRIREQPVRPLGLGRPDPSDRQPGPADPRPAFRLAVRRPGRRSRRG